MYLKIKVCYNNYRLEVSTILHLCPKRKQTDYLFSSFFCAKIVLGESL